MTTFIAPNPFFEPTDAFIAWMVENYGKHAILDVGCGYGNFVLALLRGGAHGALGIDLMADKIMTAHKTYMRDAAGLSADLENGTPTLPSRLVVGDSRKHSIGALPKAVHVFARPCHDAGWIREHVANAYQHATTFLYISKPGNAERDLAGMERRRRCVGMEVGKEGEEVWEVRYVAEDTLEDYEDGLSRWCLIEVRVGATDRFERHWVRDGDTKWYWGWGFSYISKDGQKVLEDAFILEDDAWLDRSKTSAYQKWVERVKDTSLTNGWLSPDGKLYRCAYYEHNALAADYLGMYVRDMEKAGWLKIQQARDDKRPLFILSYRPGRADRHTATQEQVQALLDAGFKPPAWFFEDSEGDWSETVAKLYPRREFDDDDFAELDVDIG